MAWSDTDDERDCQTNRRKELCELMQRYAVLFGIPFKESWRELDRQFLHVHHAGLYRMLHCYCEDHRVKMTLPAFLEETNWIDEALGVARAMVAERSKGDTP